MLYLAIKTQRWDTQTLENLSEHKPQTR
jgi:hypothetical protein